MSGVKNCPKCGGKMEKGFLASKLVGWSDKKISNWSVAGVFEAEAVIGKGPLIDNVEAYRCKECKLIVFQYGKATTANL